MSLIKSLLFTLLLAAAAVQASTRDEIERLWNPQGMAAQPAQPAAGTSARTEKPAPRWFRLSNGRQVNLADWKVVLFMQGHCPYCHQFDPVLKQLAQQYGFSVFPYTLDGQGDTAFPEALPVPPDVMQTFFPNIPVAGLVMTVLTVGLVSCAGKSLPRFWPGDFFPIFYACHLAVLGVLAP
ncbi:type-F conjugative transfer system pilin assembly thiol-disulfide isomerase TrbB [Escherichia coli]|nr:type-F conjugative transfer system pilin assembly thiol-disulfide isomerase TrbB [Escherichia coli]HCK1547899.1 type-F conjugative transfer system pilin assembly thiol-disulfide isomerase TrbB [Escherichia coli]